MISIWAERIISLLFYLLFFLVPLIVTPFNFELFEYNKMMLTYGITLIIVCSWLVRMVCDRQIYIRRTPFDIPFILFLASQTISTIFSIDRHLSLYGYYSRFNGGLLSLVTYATLFYAFVSNIKKEDVKKYIVVGLIGAVLVSFYGILERLGIDKHIWIQDVQNRVFSTLGQPNWLAAFLAIMIPISIGLSLVKLNVEKNKKFQLSFNIESLVYLIISIVLYLTLIFTKSRSGFLGFWIANISFWTILGYSVIKTKKKIALVLGCCINLLLLGFFIAGGQYILFIGVNVIAFLIFVAFIVKPQLWKSLLLVNGLFLIVNFIFQTPFEQVNHFTLPSLSQSLSQNSSQSKESIASQPTEVLETGITESGDIRRIVWKGAVDITKDNPFFGTGTETFAFAYYKYRPVEHNMTSEWDFLYNKAHNEYLNYAATTGLFGLGTYIVFIATVIIWTLIQLIKTSKLEKSNAVEMLFPISLLAGWVSILVTNFLGFSVVVVQLLFFLIPAMLVVYTASKTNAVSLSLSKVFHNENVMMPRQWILILIILLATFFFVYRLIFAYLADISYAKGYQESRSGQYLNAYQDLRQAIDLNPREVLYYDELSLPASSLAVAAFKQNEATLAGELQNQAIAASNYALLNAPQNVSFYKSRARVFYELTEINPMYIKQAIEALEIALKLSPTDPKVAYNLGLMYGKDGQDKKAIEALETAAKLKPNYREAYIALALYYMDAKENTKAKETIQHILDKINPGDADALGILEQINKK